MFTDWIVVPGRMVGIVRMEALDAVPGAADPSRRAVRRRVFPNEGVTLGAVAELRRIESALQSRIGGDALFGGPNATAGLDATDAPHGQRARQPVVRRERRTVVQMRRYRNHDRHSKVAPGNDVNRRTWLPPELGGDHGPVIHPGPGPVR